MVLFSKNKKLTIGLLGGIGPESTGHFYSSLIEGFQNSFHPKSNEGYPHIIINSISAPDLISGKISKLTLNPYIEGVKALENIGADIIGIVCNTAHCFLDTLQKNTHVPIINLPAEVKIYLQTHKVQKILILASPTTIYNKLYNFEEIQTVQMKKNDINTLDKLIRDFNLGRDRQKQIKVLKKLIAKYMDEETTILQGCTEISEMLRSVSIKKVDTMDILRASILNSIDRNSYTFLQKSISKIHGIGIFTTKKIKKNDIYYRIPATKTSKRARTGWAKIGRNIWVGDEHVLNFVNYSCEPNTSIKIYDKKPFLVALKNINPGDEICCNYSDTETNGGKVKCDCKQIKCKGYFLRVE